MTTVIHNEDCTDPSYKVIYTNKMGVTHVWLFYKDEHDLALAYKRRFDGAKLFERVWKEVN